MLAQKKICIIVPCYNPLDGWASALKERYEALQLLCADLPLTWSLCLTNDGSSKNFDAVLFKQIFPEAELVSYTTNRGKGFALRQGVAQSEADYYLMTDVDFPYTTASMRSIVETLLEKNGIAAGNRDESYYKSVPFVRKLISKTLRWQLKFILRLPVSDSQCGLKGFDNAGKKVFLETTIDRFLFDLEFLMQANKRVAVHPVPVALREGIVFSQMGFKILQMEGRNFLKLFLRKTFGIG